MIVARIRTSKTEEIFFNVKKMTLNYGDDSEKKVVCILSMGYGFKFKALLASVENPNNCYTFESDGEITEIN